MPKRLSVDARKLVLTSATEEARRFLAERPFVRATEAGCTLRLHRRVPA